MLAIIYFIELIVVAQNDAQRWSICEGMAIELCQPVQMLNLKTEAEDNYKCSNAYCLPMTNAGKNYYCTNALH